MKRTLLILIGVILCLSCAQAEPHYCAITDLRESTPNRWTATYTNSLGETIAVDCPVSLPQRDSFPILQLKIRQDVRNDATCDHRSSLPQGTIAASTLYHYDQCDGLLVQTPAYPRGLNAQAENNPLTPEEAFAAAQRIVQRYSPEAKVQPAVLLGSGCTPLTQAANASIPALDQGFYEMSLYQVFDGIPLVMSEAYDPRYFPPTDLSLTLFDESLYTLAGTTLTAVGTVEADVPLMPFDRIRTILEEDFLSTGRVTEVYGLWLGYRLTLEASEETAGVNPDSGLYASAAYDETYTVRPVWVLRCYCPNPRQRLSPDALGQIGREDVMLSRRCMVALDAQTGELVYDFYTKDTTDSVAVPLLTWDEVR